MTDWMECWEKARERVVKATFVGAGKEGLCPQMQNPRLRRGIFIVFGTQKNAYIWRRMAINSWSKVMAISYAFWRMSGPSAPFTRVSVMGIGSVSGLSKNT